MSLLHNNEITNFPRTKTSADLAAEDLVLRAEGQAINEVFDFAKRAQHSRKNEAEIGPQNLETSGAQKPARFGRSQRYGVTIERASRHHIPRRETPGIIFPKGKKSPRAKRPAHQGQGFRAI